MVTALYGLLTIMSFFMSMMFMTSSAVDILSQGQALRDGDTLVSSGGNFELGFFSPGSNSRKYVGIWFSNISARTVVWVANREIPLLDSSGVLQITNKSVLILASGKGDVLWSTNSSRSVRKPIAQLLDSGNLVVRDENEENPGNFLWQSFDYPCDSELPGMKLGKDLGKLGDWKTRVWIAVSITLSAVTLIFLCGGVALIKRKRRRQRVKTEEGKFSISKCRKGQWERPLYAFNVIARATNDFSHRNKLGEGGYGPVYKGVLCDGQEIAVKRLSKESRQGLEEFKNEILSITKLQHKNLVKHLGSCVDADERMLIYEYMPNKSLDSFIFDQSSSELLDWPKRLDIIKGIADGLVYLHENSRLKIIHRDLKASNVLLDSDMNPKISDFGLAKTFYGVEDEGRTKRVIGTYGYMPPEYAYDGLFSVKSDVYSFGVLVLEIVSGQRNRGFNHQDHHHNLLGHTWILFKEGVALDVVDPLIKNASYALEMKRAIHIGLLCVQQHPDERPCMPQVTVMLSSDCELPEPKEPGFYVPREFVSIKNTTFSNNEMSISNLYAR